MFNNIRFKKAREQSAQSTVEYIVLVTAVLGVIILFMNGTKSSFSTKLNSTLDETTNQITKKSSILSESHDSVNEMNTGESQIIVNALP